MYSSESSINQWKELVAAQRGGGERTPQSSSLGAGASQPQACIDWREQPPRKRTKQQQQQQQQLQQSPKQHKEVEKQRRDRMNQAIGSLSRLIPTAYLKQGQSRVEKAEVIELAAQHMLALTCQLEQCKATLGQAYPSTRADCCMGQFYQGFRQSSRAALNFLTDQAGFSTTDSLCCRLRSHLHDLAQEHLPDQVQLSGHSGESKPTADSTRLNHQQHQPQAEKEDQQQSDLPANQRRGKRCRSRDSSCGSTDEAPPSCGSYAEGEVEDLKRDPKSAFKKRFEAQTAAAEASHGGKSAVHKLQQQQQQQQEDEDPPLLPGFVLHESGTHYLPLVVPPSALGTELLTATLLRRGKDAGSTPLLHPVSIPVNFGATRFVRKSGGAV